MKTRRTSCALLVGLLGFLLVLAAPLAASAEQPAAFQQQDQADLVVDFWHWDSLSITKPIQNNPIQSELTKVEFLSKLATQKIRRDFVVVILDKRMAPQGKEVPIDALVGDFHRLGFRRVVVQLALGKAAPRILRDSKKEANQSPQTTRAFGPRV